MAVKWQMLLMVVLLSVVSASAQGRPDFTGTWQEDTGSSTSANIETIMQQGSELKVHRVITSTGPLTGSFQSSDQVYQTDGTEQYIAKSGGERWTTVNRQETALAFLVVARTGPGVTVTRETWTLSDDGKTLTKQRRTIGPDRVDAQKSVFRRQ
jgi:hypothetical protein